MITKQYKFFSDPGHGWLAVSRKQIQALGIEDDISVFSYQSKSKKTIYLEEDSDAHLFLDAQKASMCDPSELVVIMRPICTNNESSIRKLNSFTKEK